MMRACWLRQGPAEYGDGGADFLTSAVLLEGAGYSPLGPLAPNCAAPDEGNMHLLGILRRRDRTAIAPGFVDTEMSAWVHDRIGAGEMIPPADMAELVLALTQMSARSVIPLVTMSRTGPTQWRA